MLWNVGHLLSNKVSNLLDFFFPCLCPSCGQKVERETLFCSDCFSSLKFITPPFCYICGRPFTIRDLSSHICGNCLRKKPFFKAARAVFSYTEPVKKAIIQFKFQNNTDLASLFVKEILFHLKDFIEKIDPTLIIPVPLHLKRLRERGYNQCLLLAKKIAKVLDVPCDFKVLKKIKATPPQVGLSLAERYKNIKGSFAVIKPDYIKKKRIVLIDDVFTTGSTVNECAKVLMKAGAESVWVITLARTTDEV